MTKMRRENNQIIFLQETHLSHVEHEKLKNFGYKNTFFGTFKRGHKREVSILIHNSVNFELIREVKDSEGRYILVQGKLENNLSTLLCVYLRPHSDQDVAKKILELITSETQGTLICAGDFNAVLNCKLDTDNNRRSTSSQNKVLGRGLEEVGLLDV